MKIVKKYKGSSTTQSTIDPEFKPFIKRGLERAENAQLSGQFSNVAGFTPEQLKAQQQATAAAGQQDVLAGKVTGAADTLETAQKTGFAIDPSVLADNPQLAAMKQAAIRSAQMAIQPGRAKEAASGLVGGSRAGIVAGEQEADLAAKMAGLDYQALQDASKTAQGAAVQEIQSIPTMQSAQTAGADTLQSVGTAIQKQQQAELDKEYQGMSRFSSIVQGTPWQSQQTVSQGGK